MKRHCVLRSSNVLNVLQTNACKTSQKVRLIAKLNDTSKIYFYITFYMDQGIHFYIYYITFYDGKSTYQFARK